MRLRHLKIQGFRGIRALEWQVDARVACLIGPGDAGKTTVLDAIEYALTPRWNLPLNDVDFHGGHCGQPITIEVTIGDLPASLISEDKFGLELRGWKPEGGLRDEPAEGDEAALTVRLTVDDSLEPSWVVVNDRRPEGRAISGRDRETLGLVRLGGEVDRHLAWGRGSALSRSTEDLEDVTRVLAEAHRQARSMVDQANLTKLDAAAAKAKTAAVKIGVRAIQDYRPALDAGLLLVSTGVLGLHEGPIPLRAAGLATKRLVALAMQAMAVTEGAILLVDEIEHGLEPHRLRHLLRLLRMSPDAGKGQILLTTHSAVAVTELKADDLNIVRCSGAITSVTRVPQALQSLVRRSPETLLGRKALVCEGKTEVGLCRGLMSQWAEAHGGLPLTHTGTVLTNGEGHKTLQVCTQLVALGYATAVLADSDDPAGADAAQLKAVGVQEAALWDGALATEERVALDLPWPALQELLDLGMRERGLVAVLDVQGALPGAKLSVALVEAWRMAGLAEDDIRRALGRAAKRARWFKRTDLGEALGQLVARYLPEIPQSDLAEKLKVIENWAYAD